MALAIIEFWCSIGDANKLVNRLTRSIVVVLCTRKQRGKHAKNWAEVEGYYYTVNGYRKSLWW